VHVGNASKYAKFLVEIFNEGRFKKISEDNTYMFISPDMIRIEIKESPKYNLNSNLDDHKGFCMPCLRMDNAKKHISNIEGIKIFSERRNPDGPCYFFTDYEGIVWHIKDYQILDKYVNF